MRSLWRVFRSGNRSQSWAIICLSGGIRCRVFELCPHCHKPTLEDIDDLVANLGRREGGSVYNTTPTVELILGADDHFIGITIRGDKAFGFLYLLNQIVDDHGSGPHFRSVDRAEAARGTRDVVDAILDLLEDGVERETRWR